MAGFETKLGVYAAPAQTTEIVRRSRDLVDQQDVRLGKAKPATSDETAIAETPEGEPYDGSPA